MQTYLLCFAHNPVGHAKHYVGSTQHLPTRLYHHRRGWAASLTREVRRRGGSLKLARTWSGQRETEIKAQKNAPLLCPLCAGNRALERKVKRTVTERCKQRLARKMERLGGVSPING